MSKKSSDCFFIKALLCSKEICILKVSRFSVTTIDYAHLAKTDADGQLAKLGISNRKAARFINKFNEHFARYTPSIRDVQIIDLQMLKADLAKWVEKNGK